MRFRTLLPLMIAPLLLSAEAPGPERKGQAPAMGSPSDPDRFSNLPRLVLDDAGQILTAPLRWDNQDWLMAGGGALAVIGAGLLLDQSVDRYVVRHATDSWDRPARALQNLGGGASVVLAGGTYLAGVAFQNPEVRATGIDTMAAMGISQLLFVIPLKEILGRSRTAAGKGAHEFKPFGGGDSFPSGHAAQAFALASVVSAHADTPWVTAACYSLATGVGLARVEQRHHFLSDVVAGGLIGTFVGQAVVAHNGELRTRARSRVAWSFSPSLQPGGLGLSLAARF